MKSRLVIARRAALIAALATAAAACGGGNGSAGGGPGAEKTAALKIEVRDDEGAAPRTATLACGAKAAGGGFLADAAKAEAACKAILDDPAKAGLIEKPPPGDRVCTMVFGGPQTARVTGTFRGRIVDRTFKRSNGCEIGDWDAMVVLIGEARGGAVPQ